MICMIRSRFRPLRYCTISTVSSVTGHGQKKSPRFKSLELKRKFWITRLSPHSLWARSILSDQISGGTLLHWSGLRTDSDSQDTKRAGHKCCKIMCISSNQASPRFLVPYPHHPGLISIYSLTSCSIVIPLYFNRGREYSFELMWTLGWPVYGNTCCQCASGLIKICQARRGADLWEIIMVVILHLLVVVSKLYVGYMIFFSR